MEVIQVGKVHKVHGIRGWLKISFSYPLTALWVDELPPLLLGTEAKNLPYFPEELSATSDEQYFLIKFEGIDSPEEAILLTGKELFMQLGREHEFFVTDQEESAYDFAMGYMLLSETGEFIGTIEDIEAMPAQDLAKVSHRGKEVLIPLADELVLTVDHKARTIKVVIPDGLLTL